MTRDLWGCDVQTADPLLSAYHPRFDTEAEADAYGASLKAQGRVTKYAVYRVPIGEYT